MTTPAPATVPDRLSPRLTGVVGWAVALVLAVQFLQLTLFQATDVQAALGFRRGDLDIGRWWSVLTYQLAHGSPALALTNVYVMLLAGPRLERFWGGRRFLAFLLLAGVGGWMLHLFVGGGAPLLGASASAFAVLGATAMRWGDEEFTLAGGLTIRGRWLCALLGAMLLLLGLRSLPGGGAPFVAHLGGLAAAWLFMRATQVLLVERFREGVSAVPDDPPEDQPPRAVPKTLPRSRARDRDTIDDVVARSNAAAARRGAASRRRTPPGSPPQTAVPDLDTILDKISAEGIERLTEDERRVLDDHSRRLRDG